MSAAFAWRPPVFRRDYPKPDWRLFVEALAEHAEQNIVRGELDPDGGGERLLLGPSVPGLFGAWGLSAGILFPVAQDMRGDAERFEERYRAKLVLTYWFQALATGGRLMIARFSILNPMTRTAVLLLPFALASAVGAAGLSQVRQTVFGMDRGLTSSCTRRGIAAGGDER